jgi:hypothetical protein
MDGVEVALTYEISGWPTWVHHEGREMHWHVPEIIDLGSQSCPYQRLRPARARPVRLCAGEGEQYISATRRRGKWQIAPNTTARPLIRLVPLCATVWHIDAEGGPARRP